MFASGCGETDDGPDGGDAEIVVGALLDLSGSWQTLGKASQATLNIAALDINNRLESEGREERVRIVVEDTGLDPETALTRLQSLYDQGVRVVIGPQSSSELAMVKDFADANDMIVISQGSTASSLSLPDDNVFRLTPDDRQEADALVAMLWEDDIRNVQPVCRKDAGNLGLCASVSERVGGRGGNVLSAIEYDAGADMQMVLRDLQDALAGQPEVTTAVYLAAFDEAVDLFALAQTAGVLTALPWYGSDGMALNALLVTPDHALAAQFASIVAYPNPIFGLDPDAQATWQPVFDRVKADVGYDPDAFALSVYDGLRIAVDAYVAAGGIDDLEAYTRAFVNQARTNVSISGSTELNDAGDRRTAFFDFWAVRPTATGAFAWQRVATYQPSDDGGGTIQREE